MDESTENKLNVETLQQRIADQIQRWYVHQLGHSRVEVACHIFGNKLMVVLDNAVTQPEQLLVSSGRADFAEQVRNALDHSLRLHLHQIIEALTQVRIVDLLTTTQIKTERTSIVAILSDSVATTPPVAILPHLARSALEYDDE